MTPGYRPLGASGRPRVASSVRITAPTEKVPNRMIFTGLIVGALLGVVLQRGRFCVTGMLRDIFLLRSWRTFTALMIVIAVHAVGIAVLTGVGVISPEYPTFAPAAVVVGGLLFGMGIILAGGCASGTVSYTHLTLPTNREV